VKHRLPGLGRLWRHGFITLIAFVFSGCGIAPRTENPIPTIAAPTDAKRSKTLIVMLPGRGDRAESFRQAGFLKNVAGKDFDVIAVDAHFGYYKNRDLVPRLHNDVIVPARQNGYEKIWLLGVSMGGMGSLLYVQQHSGMIDGLILLAPYLGDPGLATEVDASGGLETWSADNSPFREHEVGIWRWLQESQTGPDQIPIYLGFGTSDRLAGTYSPLRSGTANLQVFTEDGGHKWAIWTQLWSRILGEISF
jgi:pimeloyl-ACP methyl ester carboxylesterase